MVRQLTAPELHARLQGGERPLVLDVREGWELNICALPESVHIPMREIPVRATELPRDREIVVLCHHGVRSQHVAYFLSKQGFDNLYNLAGGIDAWAKQVDRSTPTY